MDILTVSILIRKILTKGFMQIYPYNSIFCNLGILVSLLSLWILTKKTCEDRHTKEIYFAIILLSMRLYIYFHLLTICFLYKKLFVRGLRFCIVWLDYKHKKYFEVLFFHKIIACRLVILCIYRYMYGDI